MMPKSIRTVRSMVAIGQGAAMPAMRLGEAVQVEVGQDVAVDDEEGAVELIAQQAQRADGAERLRLLGVAISAIPIAARRRRNCGSDGRDIRS